VDKKKAFLTAIGDNQGLIFKVASVYTNSIEDRNDLMQEIIYQLWKSFDSFGQKSGLSTWMYRVAMNTAIYQLKLEKRKIKTFPLDEVFMDVHEMDHTETEEKWLILKRHIDNLNLLDKALVILYLDNKSYEEMAQIIGISITSIGTKLSRIKEKLKKEISKQI
jgi:RNA polymerase sigma-70 factor (ECF subfamily)